MIQVFTFYSTLPKDHSFVSSSVQYPLLFILKRLCFKQRTALLSVSSANTLPPNKGKSSPKGAERSILFFSGVNAILSDHFKNRFCIIIIIIMISINVRCVLRIGIFGADKFDQLRQSGQSAANVAETTFFIDLLAGEGHLMAYGHRNNLCN